MKLNEFKNAVDLINVDEYFQSRLKEKVTEQCAKKNRIFKKPAILGLVSVMVFAIVVAGLGINNITVKNNDNVTSQNGISSGISRVVSGFVMIAYADDKKTYTSNIEGFEMSDFPFCKIGVSDIKNKTEEEISNIIKQKKDEFHNYNDSTKYLQSHFTCERMNDTLVYFTTFGAFDFDLNESDYSSVKEIRVSNLNPEISEMEIVAQDAMYDENLQLKDNSIDYTNLVYITNYQKSYASVSGERFRRCMELEKTGNADFQINWKMANSLYETIDKNPDFDFTDIKDTVIFEVVYNNDAISKSVIDVAFDKNGNMKITPKSFDYIVK